jgi:hypothetical protein
MPYHPLISALSLIPLCLHVQQKIDIAQLAKDMQELVRVNTNPVLAFGVINDKVQDGLYNPKQDTAGNQKYQAAVNDGMGTQPVIPWRKSGAGCFVDLSMPAL